MRPITVDGRSPERNASIAATISAGFCPRSGATFVCAEALGGWHPEQEDAPGGGAAPAGAAAIPNRSGKTLTRLATLVTLSRSAGEGLQETRLKTPLPQRGRGGTKPPRVRAKSGPRTGSGLSG